MQEVLVFDVILRIAQCNGHSKATDLVMAPGSPDRAKRVPLQERAAVATFKFGILALLSARPLE